MSVSSQPIGTTTSKQVARNTFWAYLAFVIGKSLTFGAMLILTRLLAPDEFGVMAYCLIGIQYLDILNAIGSEGALIARQDRIEEAANATLLINIASGICFYTIAWLIAPLVAAFFNEPRVVDLLRVLALTLIIGALASVPNAMLQRSLAFKLKVLPDIAQAFMKGLASIILAWKGYGVWSLVLGQVIGEFTSTVLMWLLARWRPTFRFDGQVTRQMMGFGGHMALIALIGMLLTNVDYIFVGRILGAAALGYYTLAYRLPELVIRSLVQVFGQVALPVLARLQANAPQLKRVYLKYLRYIALCTFPLGVGLAATAPMLVPLLFSAKWTATIFAMQAIAISIAISSVGRIPGVLYKAVNRPGILNQIGPVKLAFAIIALWYSTRWGYNGVAVAQIVVSCISNAVDFFMVSRVIQVGFDEMLQTLLPPLSGSLMMAAAAMLLNSFLVPLGYFGLALLVITLVVTYIGTIMLVSRETIVQAGVALRATLTRS